MKKNEKSLKLKVLCQELQSLEHLSSLSLDFGRYSSNVAEEGVEILESLFNKIQGIKYLSLLSDFSFVSHPLKLKSFFFHLGELKNLISLNLDSILLEKEDIEAFFNSLKDMKLLSALFLKVIVDLFFNNKAINLFTDLLKKIPKLSQLGLKIDKKPPFQSQVINSLPALMFLDEVSLKDLTVIFSIFSSDTYSPELLSILNVGNIKSLSHLSLYHVSFEEQHYEELQTHLRKLPLLSSRTLSLRSYQTVIMTVSKMEVLSEGLKELKLLSSLELTFDPNIHVLIDVAENCAHKLCGALFQLHNLKHLKIEFQNCNFLEGNKIFLHTIKELKSLPYAELIFQHYLLGHVQKDTPKEIDSIFKNYTKQIFQNYILYSTTSFSEFELSKYSDYVPFEIFF